MEHSNSTVAYWGKGRSLTVLINENQIVIRLNFIDCQHLSYVMFLYFAFFMEMGHRQYTISDIICSKFCLYGLLYEEPCR